MVLLQVALAAARRSREGRALGTVIVNLQQTARDGEASLRMFSHTDPTFEAIAVKMGLKLGSGKVPQPVLSTLVPYNREGRRSAKVRMVLDLSKGQEIRLNPEHNCQGSRQPKLLHVFGKSGGFDPYQIVCRPPGPGEGTVEAYDPALSGWELTIEGVTLLLGGWWLEAAARGDLQSIPVINLKPSLGVEEEGQVRMLETAGSEEERLALEARVVEEEEHDREEEASKDFTGLVPEMYQATASALLGEMEEESEQLLELMEKTRKGLEDRLCVTKGMVGEEEVILEERRKEE